MEGAEPRSINERIEAGIVEGKKILTIARSLNWDGNRGIARVHARLMHRGLDREARVELQKEKNPRVIELIKALKNHGKKPKKPEHRRYGFFTEDILAMVDELRIISEIRLTDIAKNYLQCNIQSLREAVSIYRKNKETDPPVRPARRKLA